MSKRTFTDYQSETYFSDGTSKKWEVILNCGKTGESKRFQIGKSERIVGRLGDILTSEKDIAVSRVHLALWVEDQKLICRNISFSGSILNNEKWIESKTELKNGDKIHLGSNEYLMKDFMEGHPLKDFSKTSLEVRSFNESNDFCLNSDRLNQFSRFYMFPSMVEAKEKLEGFELKDREGKTISSDDFLRDCFFFFEMKTRDLYSTPWDWNNKHPYVRYRGQVDHCPRYKREAFVDMMKGKAVEARFPRVPFSPLSTIVEGMMEKLKDEYIACYYPEKIMKKLRV